MNNPTLHVGDDTASPDGLPQARVGKAAGVCRNHVGRRFLPELTALQWRFVEASLAGAVLGGSAMLGIAAISSDKPHWAQVGAIVAAVGCGYRGCIGMAASFERLTAYEAQQDQNTRWLNEAIAIWKQRAAKAAFSGKAEGNALLHAGTPASEAKEEKTASDAGVVRLTDGRR